MQDHWLMKIKVNHLLYITGGLARQLCKDLGLGGNSKAKKNKKNKGKNVQSPATPGLKSKGRNGKKNKGAPSKKGQVPRSKKTQAATATAPAEDTAPAGKSKRSKRQKVA